MGRHITRRESLESLEVKYLLINKSGVVSRIIEDIQKYKDFTSSEVLIYSVLVKDDIIKTDATLEMQYLPIHESWNSGPWPDRAYVFPSLIIEIDAPCNINDFVGKFLAGDLKCPRCGKACTTMSGYTLHMKSCKVEINSDNVIYSCKICGKKTISKFGLTNHMKSAHPGITI